MYGKLLPTFRVRMKVTQEMECLGASRLTCRLQAFSGCRAEIKFIVQVKFYDTAWFSGVFWHRILTLFHTLDYVHDIFYFQWFQTVKDQLAAPFRGLLFERLKPEVRIHSTWVPFQRISLFVNFPSFLIH